MQFTQVSGYLGPWSCNYFVLKERFLSLGRTMSQTNVTLGNIIFDIGRHHRQREAFSNPPQTTFDTTDISSLRIQAGTTKREPLKIKLP